MAVGTSVANLVCCFAVGRLLQQGKLRHEMIMDAVHRTPQPRGSRGTGEAWAWGGGEGKRSTLVLGC